MAIVAALIVFGLVMLYSSSSVYSYYENGDSASLFVKQLVFVAMGIVFCFITALIPYNILIDKFGKIAWAVTLVLLIATFFLGVTGLGAKRWIDIGFMQLQPSELAKIAIMIVLVQLIDQIHEYGNTRFLNISAVICTVIPIILILIEPDLGTTIIAVVGVLAVLWFGGIPKRHIAIATGVMIVLGIVMISVEGFRQNRLGAFIDPYADPLGSGYQILNSFYAFGDGGLFGVGVGLSRQKFIYLPEAQNDFIFAIVGEELGLFGALTVVALFMGFLYAAFKIASNAPDKRGTMLAGSAAVLIGFQAFLNMLCVVGAAPVTGKPLPFFSAGGTSMISTMILVGLILSVSLQSKLSVHEQRREQLLIINGGGDLNRHIRPGDKPARRSTGGNQLPKSPAMAPAARNKVVPISRARATVRPDQGALSMASLRKNRSGLTYSYSNPRSPVPKSSTGNRKRRQGGAA
jgi:cell division protein FtsW